MKYGQLSPCPTIKKLFSYSVSFQLPEVSGCYVITNFSEEILYIGLSKCLKKRFCQHLDSKEKTESGAYGRPSFFNYLLTEERFLEKIERTWMHQFEILHGHLPVLNKVSSPLV
ncbi:GIY-YIG nuclease family protein [Desulfobulbus sp. F4]|nr:GIY-YIG nuclease family protein [Desulfobulbus sp. F4]